MDAHFAQRLCRLNNRFYEENAPSFSATRQSGWPGWERCLEATGLAGGEGPSRKEGARRNELRVLDVACGNLRFEAFLEQAADARQSAVALDACASLPVARSDTRFAHCDIIEELSRGTLCERLAGSGDNGVPRSSAEQGFDLAVCFGFMHHVPLPQWRAQLLRAMLGAVKPGGFVCASFWRFADDSGLTEKAQRTHREGCIELGLNPANFNEGDFLLGWKNREGAYRYCHSFSDADIDELAASLPPDTKTAARFRADGRTGNLNEYLVLQA